MNQEETKYQRLTETDMTIGMQNLKMILTLRGLGGRGQARGPKTSSCNVLY